MPSVIKTLTSVAICTFALAACQTKPPISNVPQKSGPKAEYNNPPVGTTFTILNEQYRVTKSEDAHLSLQAPGGASVDLYAGVIRFWNRDERVFEASSFTDLWPIQVGNQAQEVVRVKNGRISWRYNVAVVGREMIEVPAGNFDSYVIKVHQQSSTRAYEGVSTYWVSTKLGFPVKREHKHIRGSSAPKDFELQNYKFPKDAQPEA